MIRPGEEWGRPYDGRTAVPAASDAELAQYGLFNDSTGRPDARPCIELRGGDLFHTLGGYGAGPTATDDRWMMPVDLMAIRIDDHDPIPAAAHVVVGRRMREQWTWWGHTIAVCNAAFVEGTNLAPRGHPNDGRVSIVDMSLIGRQWLLARPRLRTGGHLPHPRIGVTTTKSAVIDLGRRRPVVIDGIRAGTARHLSVDVIPDAVEVILGA